LGGWWSGPLQVENTPAGAAGRGVRLRYVDALRGIAALLVLALHVANHYHALSPATAAHGRWLNDFAANLDIGRIGVVVFFLISGFVVPFSIHAESAAPVRGFAIRRLFRIFPAYWLSVPLAAFTFALLTAFDVNHLNAMLRLQPPGGCLILSLRIEILYVNISDGRAHVGEAPRDALVVSDDHIRQSGQRYSRYVECPGAQMRFVPQVRHLMRKMHVICEQRFSGHSVRTGDDPIVGSIYRRYFRQSGGGHTVACHRVVGRVFILLIIF